MCVGGKQCNKEEIPRDDKKFFDRMTQHFAANIVTCICLKQAIQSNVTYLTCKLSILLFKGRNSGPKEGESLPSIQAHGNAGRRHQSHKNIEAKV